jgi:glycosyltransferase involved in cell wall biosynthesis
MEATRNLSAVPAGRAPDVSVLIPVLNEERDIRDTVAAMQAQQFDGEVEFLFMDGRSEDRTKAILQELAQADPRIRVLDNPARHTAAGLNVGLRAARGHYVARMDAHTIYPDSYLAAGVARLRRGDVDWVTGPTTPEPRGVWSRRVALALRTRLGTGESNRWQTPEEGSELELDTGVFTGVWERRLLERHGGWDEGWPINQDSELAVRMLRDGARIVSIGEMEARYFPRNSLRALTRQYFRYGMYRCKTASRHPDSMRLSLLAPPGLATALCAAFLGPRLTRRLARLGLVSYAVLAVAVSSASLREAGPRDTACIPIALATMHLAWGFGFLVGAVRFGPPWRAVLTALRERR